MTTRKAVKEQKKNENLGIYWDEDPDFDEMTTAMQILHDELSERDETLAKLKAFGVQLAGMSAQNAQDIAKVKQLLRGLEKSDQIDVSEAEEAEGVKFLDFLDQLPTKRQAAMLDQIIGIAGRARTRKDFDHGLDALIPSLYAQAPAEPEAPEEEEEEDEGEDTGNDIE